MASQKICVTSINYDSGRITTCVVSINEKNYTVKWANGKYEVAAGREVVNCGDATKSGADAKGAVTGADAKGAVTEAQAKPDAPGAEAKLDGSVPNPGAKQAEAEAKLDGSVPNPGAKQAEAEAKPVPHPPLETKTFATHEELINKVMTDLKLKSTNPQSV